eukprot:3141735-Amphidinium_carterae.1
MGLVLFSSEDPRDARCERLSEKCSESSKGYQEKGPRKSTTYTKHTVSHTHTTDERRFKTQVGVKSNVLVAVLGEQKFIMRLGGNQKPPSQAQHTRIVPL